MCFFFFKQKTAYDMRISDWSSDVCSSDLRGDRDQTGRDQRLQLPLPGGVSVAAQIDGERQRNGGADGMRVVVALERLFEVADRKSVVSGKSVSVRVDLGGRRIIKKKKQ